MNQLNQPAHMHTQYTHTPDCIAWEIARRHSIESGIATAMLHARTKAASQSPGVLQSRHAVFCLQLGHA